MRFRSHRLVTRAALLICAAPALLAAAPPPGECPQPRFTGRAPDQYYTLRNPLESSARALQAGERLYLAKNGCSICHGKRGDGKGQLAAQFDPRPRNFACAETVKGIPDGQLFWIIRFGSPGTSMPDHPDFTDEQIWQIILHLRRLAG
jgi:mono/diheme cytochrome c family protein